MPNALIVLMAEARKAGVEGYRNMSEADLRAAIKSAKGTGSAPAKGKTTTSTNGTKGKTAAKKVVKGKTAVAKGKSKTATPAKGKSKTTTRKGSTSKTAPAKSTTRKSTVKTAAAKGAQAKRPSTGRGKVSHGTRASIKDAKIDWHLESNVGQFGKRAEVLDALAEHKGDYAKVFKALKRKATKFYPDRSKEDAEKMLVWLIGRVAYDYAYKTGQHQPAKRAAYGTSDKPADVARREARAAARKPKRSPAKRKSTTRKGR